MEIESNGHTYHVTRNSQTAIATSLAEVHLAVTHQFEDTDNGNSHWRKPRTGCPFCREMGLVKSE